MLLEKLEREKGLRKISKMLDDSKFQRFLIKDFEHWRVYLHEQQNYLGRVYLWAKRENINFFNMTHVEAVEFMHVGGLVTKSIRDAFNPDKFDYAIFGNTAPHIHMHIIPRYKFGRLFCGGSFEDRNWGKNYAPYDKREFDERVLTEIRLTIRDKLENK